MLWRGALAVRLCEGESMTCLQCGAENRERAKFCHKCGVRLTAPQAAAEPPGAAPTSVSGRSRSSPPPEPRPGEIIAVPIVRKPPTPAPPEPPRESVPVKAAPAPRIAVPPAKLSPVEQLPAASPPPFFTSFMPAQKNKQHQRLVLFATLMLLVTVAVFALAYYALTKSF